MDPRIADAQQKLSGVFARLDQIEQENTRRILDAFAAHRVAERHFAGTSGYGYGDEGRDTLEKIYADVFGAQAALVRPAIASGTHALAIALFGVLRPGQTLLAATGKPYDTLEEVIGIAGDGDGSLRQMGVSYRQVELDGHGAPDFEAIARAVDEKTALVAVQRSCGYAMRPSLGIEQIERIVRVVKQKNPNAAVMVDNCYGEFTQTREPTHVGADLIAGSLIKNPGGGLAPTGGYLCGRADLIEKCAKRLTSPGIGAEVGSYTPGYRLFYQGLFLAPHVVMQAVRGAALCAQVFSDMGYEVLPAPQAPRNDIIQAIKLGSGEKLIRFCQAVQAASPVEGYVLPEPWDMPGYTSPVIMAAGTFVSGASIELSADGPMRPPFAAYLQGGLTYTHVVLALEKILGALEETPAL